jgi:hypothetical protein
MTCRMRARAAVGSGDGRKISLTLVSAMATLPLQYRNFLTGSGGIAPLPFGGFCGTDDRVAKQRDQDQKDGA